MGKEGVLQIKGVVYDMVQDGVNILDNAHCGRLHLEPIKM